MTKFADTGNDSGYLNSSGVPRPADYGTSAYSNEGVPLWTHSYSGDAVNNGARAIAVDGQGNVFVTGASAAEGGGGEPDYATIKYSNAGVPLWTNRYDGTGTSDEAHPGIDIAVAVGSIVRASGGGTVHQLGEDPEYGFFVLLDHLDDYQTMYGHLSRILVEPGASVAPGQVIGLSGTSGRSTAPHLHFEIRQKGVSLDPRTMVKEGS